MTQFHDPALPREADAQRFAFGDNWWRFLATLTDERIARAEASLRQLLTVNTLAGKRFLDAGSGSGLFSLAAARLGATVHSFDFDEKSVRCTRELQRRFSDAAARWTVERGSVLDETFLRHLGNFDIVYSWGVLHHTGDMWRALANVERLVRPGGTLCVALYNDQGLSSRVWRMVKRWYNTLPPVLRGVILWPACVRLWGPTIARDSFKGSPLATWRSYGAERGMSPMVDVVDWVGGYPFEVASIDQVVNFCAAAGFVLRTTVPRNGIGCNEFVFARTGAGVGARPS